jgi:hypothetical protein
LETWLGLLGNADDNEYLRVERYRQVLKAVLKEDSSVFYAASFAADAFSTANVMLNRRDELLLAGFDFNEKVANLPNRLAIWSKIERMLPDFGGLVRGEADLLIEITKELPKFQLPITQVHFYDDFGNLPYHWQRIFNLIFASSQKTDNQEVVFKNTSLEAFSPKQTSTDLDAFRQKIALNIAGKTEAKFDGSLLIIKAKRESDLAEWLAKIVLQNPDFKPLCLIPETNRSLDAAFVMEGLPTMGIASSSSARPVLQLLKLVTAFLWKPLDPHRILEFLSLSLKPLDDRLALTIAQVMAEKPGMYSQLWAARLKEYWEGLEAKIAEGRNIDIFGIKNQFEFWFERRRYDATQRVPKTDIIAIFDYLSKWAIDTYLLKKTPSLLVLANQAEKISELLQEVQERDLSNLELDRIIRTVYKPSPVTLEERQIEALPYIHAEGAFASSVQDLVWWNFTDHSSTPALTFWRRDEVDFLAKANVLLEDKVKENRVSLQHSQRPILAAQRRLLLLVPSTINGKEAVEHPLMGYLHATFKDCSPLIFDLENYDFCESKLKRFFSLPQKEVIDKQTITPTLPFIEIPELANIKSTRDYESLTSLEDLLYYPYKWAFRYKAKLSKSAILSIAKDKRLMGNLAHRAFELMLRENFTSWSQSQVNQWINDNMPDVMFKEGATLLMYGKEQEREMFLNRLKYAAWSLISMINNNNWKVVATEQAMDGTFNQIQVKGKADLILERSDGEYAIVDLKWSGITSRKNMLNNMEDLQLVMYAALIQQDQLPHTAYFIMDKGKMLSRNALAFREAEIVNRANADAEEVHRLIYKRMKATHEWRQRQLAEGRIEVRTSITALELERIYEQEAENLLDILEMKLEDARYDEFGVIVQGVR